MNSGRLEAFSDGVIAIIITIMVLELKVPHEPSVGALLSLMPVFLSYALSFTYVGIFWNNHHHMFHLCERVTGPILWANLHFLFWLSLLPFTTAWAGENPATPAPTALYGGVLFMAAVGYWILQSTIIRAQGQGSLLKKAVGHDKKGKITPALYLAGIAMSFWEPWIAQCLYLLVALVWLIPDRRIEATLRNTGRG